MKPADIGKGILFASIAGSVILDIWMALGGHIRKINKEIREHTRREICGAKDGKYGECTLSLIGHPEDGWHQEWRGGELWTEWRGPMPDEKCRICGKDGREHGT